MNTSEDNLKFINHMRRLWLIQRVDDHILYTLKANKKLTQEEIDYIKSETITSEE